MNKKPFIFTGKKGGDGPERVTKGEQILEIEGGSTTFQREDYKKRQWRGGEDGKVEEQGDT